VIVNSVLLVFARFNVLCQTNSVNFHEIE